MSTSETPERRPLQGPRSARDVYASATPATSLGALDEALGYGLPPQDVTSPTHLYWYQSVRQRPIASLGDDDLAAVLDEGIHLPVVVPIALERLGEWPSRPSTSLVELVRACGRACRWVKGTAPALGRECRATLERIASRSEPPSQASIRDAVVAARADLDALEPPPFPRHSVALPPPPAAPGPTRRPQPPQVRPPRYT